MIHLEKIMKKVVFLFVFIGYFVSAQNKADTLDLSEYPHRFTLQKQIGETSGVEYYKGFLYTFNDSDNPAEIYKLDAETGHILQTLKVKGAKNVDWEEITRKGDTLFIGDFGNNLGNRKDLMIYSIKLPKDTVNEWITVDVIDKIPFVFEDQTDFSNTEYLTTNFDCEAFVYYNGNLHIFTKQWGNNQTTHYQLDLNSDENPKVARKIETFNTECAITGAYIFNNELYMIGYTKETFAYVWKFSRFSDGKFFNDQAQKIFIGFTPSISQVEGIAVTEDKVYITGEGFEYFIYHADPTLYVIDKGDLKSF